MASPAAKLFGFSRLAGEETHLLFEVAIAQLIEVQQLADTNGVLRPVEQEG